jgi:transposase
MTFAEKLAIALPFARKTRRVGELVRLFGHAAGGRVSERLLAGLGTPISDSAVLRQLKSHVRKHRQTKPLRAIAIDDWSWRKGSAYRTIIVDFERRTVADVLKTRFWCSSGSIRARRSSMPARQFAKHQTA